MSHCGSKVPTAGSFVSILRVQRLLASNQFDFGLVVCSGFSGKSYKAKQSTEYERKASVMAMALQVRSPLKITLGPFQASFRLLVACHLGVLV